MFDLVILVIVDIVSEVLFDNLVELFYLFIGLEMKSYRKFAIYFEFCCKCYKEL